MRLNEASLYNMVDQCGILQSRCFGNDNFHKFPDGLSPSQLEQLEAMKSSKTCRAAASGHRDETTVVDP